MVNVRFLLQALKEKILFIYHGILDGLDKQVSEDEEEGRVALNSVYIDNPNDESGIALLDTELPVKKTRKKRACCMCCGLE